MTKKTEANSKERKLERKLAHSKRQTAEIAAMVRHQIAADIANVSFRLPSKEIADYLESAGVAPEVLAEVRKRWAATEVSLLPLAAALVKGKSLAEQIREGGGEVKTDPADTEAHTTEKIPA